MNTNTAANDVVNDRTLDNDRTIESDLDTRSATVSTPLNDLTASMEPAYTTVNTDPDFSPDEVQEVTEVRNQIEETRAHLSETIDAIQERLSPAHLIEQAKESAKAATVEVASDLKDATLAKASEFVGSVVDKAKDATATATDVAHNVADYVVEKTTPIIEQTKEKLAPVVEVARNVTTTAKGTGESLMDTIRTNPIPIALIAVGLGWLLAGPRRPRSIGDTYSDTYRANNAGGSSDLPPYNGDRNGHDNNGIQNTFQTAKNTVQDAADAVTGFATDTRDKAANLVGQVGDKASDLANTARQQAGTLATTAKEKTQDTVSFLDQWVHEEPLAAGAIALLVGAAVGLALPGTPQEDQFFGPKRDALAEKATETAHQMVGKVQDAAQNAVDSARDALGNMTEQGTQAPQMQQTVNAS